MEEIADLIQQQEVCVLATAAKSQPHCSFMAYISDEECRTIYMLTHRNTRKYANMLANSAVSLLIDNRMSDETVMRTEIKALTVKGRFEEIGDEVKIRTLRRRFIKRHPHLKKFAEDDKAVMFAVAVASFQLQRNAEEGVYEDIE